MPAGSKKRKQAKKGPRKQQQQPPHQPHHDAPDRSRDSSPLPSPGRSSDGNGRPPADFDYGGSGGHSSDEEVAPATAAAVDAAAAASVSSSSSSSVPANPMEETLTLEAVVAEAREEENNNKTADSSACDNDHLRGVPAETCHSSTENAMDDCHGEEEAVSSLISANESVAETLTLAMAAKSAQREDEEEEESSSISVKDPETLTLAAEDAAMSTEGGKNDGGETPDSAERLMENDLGNRGEEEETRIQSIGDAAMVAKAGKEEDNRETVASSSLASVSNPAETLNLAIEDAAAAAEAEKGEDLGGSSAADRSHLLMGNDSDETLTLAMVAKAQKEDDNHISTENDREETVSPLISVNSCAEETLTLDTEGLCTAVDSNREDDGGIQQKGLFPSVSVLEGEIPLPPSGLITSVILGTEKKENEAAEAISTFGKLVDFLSAEELPLPEDNALEGAKFSDISREDDDRTAKEQLLPTVSALEGEIPCSFSSLDNTRLTTSTISEGEKENEMEAVAINELIDSLPAEKSPVLEEDNAFEWEILDISAVEEAGESSVGELPLPLDLTAEGENIKEFPSDLMEDDKEILSDLAAVEGELLSELMEKGQVLSDLSAKGSFLSNSSARNSDSNREDCNETEIDSKKPLDSVDSVEGTKNELISSSSVTSARNSDSNRWEYDESEITSKKLVDSHSSIEKFPSLSKISVEGTKDELIIASSLVETVTESGHDSLPKEKEDGDLVKSLGHSYKEHRNINLQEEASLDDIVDTIVEESFVPMSEMGKVEGEEEGNKKKGMSGLENSINNDGSEGSLMEPRMETIPEEIVHAAAQKALIDGKITSKEELEKKKSSPLKDSTAIAAQSRSLSGGKEEDKKETESWEFVECSVMPTYSEVASDVRSPSFISSNKEIVQGSGNYRREVGGFAQLKGCCGVIDWLAGRRG